MLSVGSVLGLHLFAHNILLKCPIFNIGYWHWGLDKGSHQWMHYFRYGGVRILQTLLKRRNKCLTLLHFAVMLSDIRIKISLKFVEKIIIFEGKARNYES